MSKISVKGSKMHPLYQFLTQLRQNGFKSSSVSWNFQKYLIGREGYLEKIVSPRTQPLSEDITSWIEEKIIAFN